VSFSALAVLSSPRGALTCAAVSLALALLPGCDPETGSSGDGGAGGIGAGGLGCCLREPLPTFVLDVLEREGGPVPPDTVVKVHWSAGEEPPIHLDDPATWPTLDTSSIQCDLDPNEPPPADLMVLSCALWTGSPIEVTVSAQGYETELHTYSAEPSSDCNPEPTPIEIELAKIQN
jgi:hypothetical protein